VVSVRCATNGSGPANLRAATRISGTDYVTNTQAAPGAFGPLQFLITTSPASGAAWGRSEVNNAEFGLKSAA
jgi:hypothetical protein